MTISELIHYCRRADRLIFLQIVLRSKVTGQSADMTLKMAAIRKHLFLTFTFLTALNGEM